MQLREEAGEVVCSRAQRERREIGNYRRWVEGRFHIKDLSLHPKSDRKSLTA